MYTVLVQTHYGCVVTMGSCWPGLSDNEQGRFGIGIYGPGIPSYMQLMEVREIHHAGKCGS